VFTQTSTLAIPAEQESHEQATDAELGDGDRIYLSANSIRRMALVTDGSALGRVARFLGEPVAVAIGVGYECFDDRVAAWKWLRSDPD
jgi:hypothetical protein